MGDGGERGDERMNENSLRPQSSRTETKKFNDDGTGSSEDCTAFSRLRAARHLKKKGGGWAERGSKQLEYFLNI